MVSYLYNLFFLLPVSVVRIYDEIKANITIKSAKGLLASISQYCELCFRDSPNSWQLLFLLGCGGC